MMTSIRWLLIFTTGLFILLATAAVQAFRLRDASPKAIASENLLKKVAPPTKCESCDKPSVDIFPAATKVKTPVLHSVESKLNHIVPSKNDLTAKKVVPQIRAGFRIKVSKKDDTDEDDNDDDEDDSENDTDIVESDDSDEDNNYSEEHDGTNSDQNEESDEDSEDDDDDDDDDDDKSDVESNVDKKKTKDFDDSEDEDDDSDDEDDDETLSEDEPDDDDDSEDDDDDKSDVSEGEETEDEDSDSDKTDSDGETVIVIKSNIKSSIKTVKEILKETLKSSKPVLKTEIQTDKKEDALTQKKTATQPEIVKKEHISPEKSHVQKSEEKKVEAKTESKPKVAPAIKEPAKIELKKETPQKEVLKHDTKKLNDAPTLKKEPPIGEPKKEPQKTLAKNIEIKSEPKKDHPKPTESRPALKLADIPKHADPPKVTKDVKPNAPKVKPEKNEEPKKLIKENKVKLEWKTKNEHESRIQDAIRRKNLRESDFEDFYTFFPTFAPNFSRIHNSECRRQGQILVRQLKGAKIWPLLMLDSTAKLPSGVLKGNGNQLGDFDQCIGTNAKVRLNSGTIVKVTGKYCLAQIDLKPVSEETKLPIHLAQARNFIRSTNIDPGHFIPRFTSLNWGVCLPAACDAPEAEFVLRDALRHYNGTIGMKIMINVDPINCYTEDDSTWSDWFDIPTIGTLIFYALVISITAYATLVDVLFSNKTEETKSESNENDNEKSTDEVEEKTSNNEESEGGNEITDEPPVKAGEITFIKSFSLKQTTAKLLNEASAEGDIECIHGIRALGSIALYVAHKLIPLAMTPFTNRIELTELSNSPFSVALRASLLYTDSFLLLSGILTAYHMSQDLDRTGTIPWMKRFIARYLRLTPALVAVLLWYAFISDKIGEGPMWGTVVTQNAELCQENMWQNIFYLQNFFPFEDMCATHTHQLALDMQLWWLAPMSVWILRSRPTWALAVLGGLHSLTVWLRYSSTQSEYLSLVIYHGITVNQLYRTANLCYTLALHRATPYLAGISLGVLLQQTGKDLSLSKFFYIPGWLLSMYFGIWALYTPAHMSMRDYKYNVDEASQYAALASVAWSLSLSWIIFTCFTGNAGPINRMLCSKPLVFLSRISYSMYLCQFLIFFYNIGSTRTSSEFSLISSISVMELIVVIIISTIITLLLDIPMQSAKKSIMSIEFGKNESQEEGGDTTEPNKEENEPEKEEPQQDLTEVDEPIQDEVYEYDEEQLENQHYQIEQDVIYEEEEEEEYDPEHEQYDENQVIYEADEEIGEADPEEYEGQDDQEDDKGNNEGKQGEEDDDLQEWEWTNGELCYYPRR